MCSIMFFVYSLWSVWEDVNSSGLTEQFNVSSTNSGKVMDSPQNVHFSHY